MDLRKLNEWPHLLCRAIEFLTLLVFLVEKWLVSRFSGSKEADLHFSLGSFSGHYLVSSDDQSAWSIYTKYSLDDVVFVLWGRFNLFIAAWLGQWDFFLFFFMAAGLNCNRNCSMMIIFVYLMTTLKDIGVPFGTRWPSSCKLLLSARPERNFF